MRMKCQVTSQSTMLLKHYKQGRKDRNSVSRLFAGDPWLRLTVCSPALLPTHYFTAHQSAIRSLAWVRAPVYDAEGEETADDPTVIVSGGYDGVECVTDIRTMSGNVMNRTRGELCCLPAWNSLMREGFPRCRDVDVFLPVHWKCDHDRPREHH